MSNYWLDQYDDLELWTNDMDFIVAYNEQDAKEICHYKMGYTWDDMDGWDWHTIDEASFTYQDAFSGSVTRQVGYYIAAFGHGHVCSRKF